MEQKNQITEGVIWKQLLIFFFPIVIGTFFQQVYNTADSIVVGRFVGKEALAAVSGSVNQIVTLIVEVFVGLTSGASVIIAQFYGAKDHKNLNRTLHTAYAFAIVTGAIVGLIGFWITEKVLIAMKTPSELMADSVIYLHIYFCGMIFNIVYNMGASILRAVGDSRRPLYVLIMTCGLNIFFDIMLVVFLKMGVMGVAIATVSCQGISACMVTWILIKGNSLFRLKIREIRFYMASLQSVLRIGIPAALEATMYTIANLIIQILLLHGEHLRKLMLFIGWLSIRLVLLSQHLSARIMVRGKYRECEKASKYVYLCLMELQFWYVQHCMVLQNRYIDCLQRTAMLSALAQT